MKKLETSAVQYDVGVSAGRVSAHERFQKVERAVVQFMEQNNSQLPSVETVRTLVGGGSNRELCPLVRDVKQKLMALQTKLATMPEIPEELTFSHAQALKDMWAKTREYQVAEIMDLKRAQQARDAMHAEEINELYDIIAKLEADWDVAVARAETAESQLDAARGAVDAMTEALSLAEARLAERDKIMSMLMAAKQVPREHSAKRAGKAAKEEKELNDELLPGFNAPSAEASDLAGPQ